MGWGGERFLMFKEAQGPREPSSWCKALRPGCPVLPVVWRVVCRHHLGPSGHFTWAGMMVSGSRVGGCRRMPVPARGPCSASTTWCPAGPTCHLPHLAGYLV